MNLKSTKAELIAMVEQGREAYARLEEEHTTLQILRNIALCDVDQVENEKHQLENKVDQLYFQVDQLENKVTQLSALNAQLSKENEVQRDLVRLLQPTC